jgi:hypothetical protein
MSDYLSIAAIVISIFSIYFSRIISQYAWMRETRLPFYLELTDLISYTELNLIFGYSLESRMDFNKFIVKAQILGIKEVAYFLEDLRNVNTASENEYENNGKISKKYERSIRQKTEGLRKFIEDDVEELTRKRTIGTISKSIWNKFFW